MLPAATAVRWIERIAKLKGAEECIARLGQSTGDATRDLPPSSLEMVRRALAAAPELLAMFEGDAPSDLDSMARIFGEELPSGLVLVDTAQE